MPTWEYKTIKIVDTGTFGPNFNLTDLDEKLNHLGKQGWEVISALDLNVFRGASSDVVVILKRPRTTGTA